MAWLDGFLSATNWWIMDAERNDIQNDGAAIDGWIRKWCEQNATKHLIEAASAFVWDQRQEYLLSYFADNRQGENNRIQLSSNVHIGHSTHAVSSSW
jgi:hypothetical protein